MTTYQLMQTESLDKSGLSAEQSKSKKQVVDEVQSFYSTAARPKLYYTLLQEVLNDLDEEREARTLSEKEKKMASSIGQLWSGTHLHLAQKQSGVIPSRNLKTLQSLDRECSSFLHKRLLAKLDERISLITSHLSLKGDDQQTIQNSMSDLQTMEENLESDIHRLWGEIRILQARTIKSLGGACSSLQEVYAEHRRHLGPHLAVCSARMNASEAEALVSKLERLTADARRAVLLQPNVLKRLRKIEQDLKTEERKMSQEIEYMEKLLSQYYSAEDAEYRSILEKYGNCQQQMTNREWAMREFVDLSETGDPIG